MPVSKFEWLSTIQTIIILGKQAAMWFDTILWTVLVCMNMSTN